MTNCYLMDFYHPAAHVHLIRTAWARSPLAALQARGRDAGGGH